MKFYAVVLLLAIGIAAKADSSVTASDVVDRETLAAFVASAKAVVDSASSAEDPATEYLKVLDSFREDERWKSGSVYLYIGDLDAVMLFHAVSPELEGQNLWELEDANGVKISQELVAAAQRGGGFVEYLWPDPALGGDIGKKIGYALSLTVLGEELVIGSGFYPRDEPTSVGDISWGRLKTFF